MKTILLLITLLLTPTLSAKDLQPCWLNNPVTSTHMGFIGVAAPFSSKVNGSLYASREKALTRLSHYLNVSFDPTILPIKKDVITLNNGQQVIFSTPFTNAQGLYSYAMLNSSLISDNGQTAWLNKQCAPTQCNFQHCSPSWLCSGNGANINSVSQLTSRPSRQLAKTYENAQDLLKLIKKSYVNETNSRVSSTGSFQTWSSYTRSADVAALGDDTRILHTHSCQANSYLFARYQHNLAQPSIQRTFNEWFSTPNLPDQTGVVGIFDGLTADGLLSSAVKASIKEGLIELAKIKDISIDHSYQLKFINGWYSLEKSSEKTSAIVHAKLQDIKIEEKNDKLTIYTWLLANKS